MSIVIGQTKHTAAESVMQLTVPVHVVSNVMSIRIWSQIKQYYWLYDQKYTFILFWMLTSSKEDKISNIFNVQHKATIQLKGFIMT